MTNTEITTRVSNLPTLPVVYATSMIYAQGWKPTGQEREAIKARADFFESMEMDRSVNIRVLDPHTNGQIGSLIYNA